MSIRRVRKTLDAARREMIEARAALESFDDQLKLGAFETKKIGEYFNGKAGRSPAQAAELRSLGAAFTRTGSALLRSLERNGYKLSAEDLRAYGKVDEWQRTHDAAPDLQTAAEIKSFVLQEMGEFIDAYPAVWKRLADKDPGLKNKVIAARKRNSGPAAP